MYVEILNDRGEINSTLFLQYKENKLDEYVLEWNPDYRMDKKDDGADHNMPIRISRNERLTRIINPLQVRLEMIKEQSDPIANRPFLAIKSLTTNNDLIDSVWIGILDINSKRVTHCH